MHRFVKSWDIKDAYALIYISESLLKKKLKVESSSFSRRYENTKHTPTYKKWSFCFYVAMQMYCILYVRS